MKRPYITFDSIENHSILNLAGVFYYRDRRGGKRSLVLNAVEELEC